jgi:competence ComEA-like helix-hairpin-helix protein
MVKVGKVIWFIVFYLFTLFFLLHAAQGVINVNTATKEEFMMLPGIGEKTAVAIVSYRQSNGPFKAIDDMTCIKGFSRKKLDKIRQYLVLKGQNTYIPVRVPRNLQPNSSKLTH